LVPELDIFSFGVNVAVYVAPSSSVVIVPNVPPLTSTSELSNTIVDGFIENVIMEVSPEVNTVLLDEIVHVTSSSVVSILILNVFEVIEVVRSLLVPDTDMYPVGLYELTSGVNVAVYFAPLF
jgi:hypothetical protein